MKIQFCGVATAALAVLAAFAGPARADVDLETFDACAQTRFDAEKNAGACLEIALSECLGISTNAASVATLCFRDAREGWNAGLRARMETLRASASADVSAIAGIEVKYDLLAGLLQCDRVQELALAVSGHNEEAILRQTSQCQAAATGAAYLRLMWRMQASP